MKGITGLDKIKTDFGEILDDENQDEVEIDLLEILKALKKKFMLILAAGLLAGCISGAFTHFMLTPSYKSTSSMLVLSKETTLTSLADLQLGSSLTSDYTVLLNSTPVLQQVIKNLGLKEISDEDLRKKITVENPSDSRILEITVEDSDPVLAKKLVDEIADVASDFIGDKMEVIPPKIIEEGKIPVVRSSPSLKKNMLLGLIFGIFVCSAVVAVYAIMDDTLKTEDDVIRYLDTSVLASVPDRKDYVNYNKRKGTRR